MTPGADLAYNAVCYRCGYVGLDAGVSRCPLCEFAIILEPGRVPERTLALVDIFARDDADAPPLPGVDARPRQAQLLAERRRRRPAPARRAVAADPDVDLRPSGAMAFGLLSALVAGLVAAVLVRGGL